MRRPIGRRLAAGGLVLAGLVLLTTGRAQDPALVDRGRSLFAQVGCYGCHTLGTWGTPIAPDLSRSGAKYEEGQLVRWLRSPAAQRPMRHMPEIELTDGEARAIAAFLATLR
jgi:mono/diheme cytochrome c family protein